MKIEQKALELKAEEIINEALKKHGILSWVILRDVYDGGALELGVHIKEGEEE